MVDFNEDWRKAICVVTEVEFQGETFWDAKIHTPGGNSVDLGGMLSKMQVLAKALEYATCHGYTLDWEWRKGKQQILL